MLRGTQTLCTLSVRTYDICNNKHSVHPDSVKPACVSEVHCTLIRVLHRPPREPLWIADERFIHTGRPCCHPTNSVRSLKVCDQKLGDSIGPLWPNSIATACDLACNRINLSTDFEWSEVTGSCNVTTFIRPLERCQLLSLHRSRD